MRLSILIGYCSLILALLPAVGHASAATAATSTSDAPTTTAALDSTTTAALDSTTTAAVVSTSSSEVKTTLASTTTAPSTVPTTTATTATETSSTSATPVTNVTTTIITNSSTSTAMTNTTTSTWINSDCTSNVYEFVIAMSNVDTASSTFEEDLKVAIARALATRLDCVILDPLIGTTRRLQANQVQIVGDAGVAPGTTASQVQASLDSQSFENNACLAVGTIGCAVTSTTVTTATTTIRTTLTTTRTATTTTTTEMPWGLPWWAWLLICCGLLLLCALCASPAFAAPMMGGKKKSKTNTGPVQYEVVDVPDYESMPLTGGSGSYAGAPMATATAAVPMATTTMPYQGGGYGYPTATTTYPYSGY